MPAKAHLLHRAQEFARGGRPVEARRLILALLNDEPGDESAWMCYAETFSDLDDRLRVYERALRQRPDMPRVRLSQTRLAQEREGLALLPVTAVPAQAAASPPSGRAHPARGRQGQAAGRQGAFQAMANLEGGSGGQVPPLESLAAGCLNSQWLNSFMCVMLAGFIVLAAVIMIGQVQTNRRLIAQNRALQADMRSLQGQMTLYQETIRGLVGERTALQAKLTSLDGDYQAKIDELRIVSDNLARAQADQAVLGARFQELQARYDDLQRSNQNQAAHSQDLQAQVDRAYNEYRSLELRYQQLQLQRQNSQFSQASLTPPYVTIKDQRVYLTILRSSGIVTWEFPIEALTDSVKIGASKRMIMEFPGTMIPLRKVDGRVIYSHDYVSFVDPTIFEDVMSDLQREIPDRRKLMEETWFIVSHLDHIDRGDLDGEPQMPMETLMTGRGDCADTAILFASMLKAADVDWNISFVIMDRHHWNEDQRDYLREPNHVAVSVDFNEDERHIVETTDPNIMEPYTASKPDAWFKGIHLEGDH